MRARGRRQAGVTLVELVVVLAIIGVLAAIAYPAYTQFRIQTNRTDATRTLQLWAQSLERCYSVNFTYAPPGPPAGCNVIGTPVTDGSTMGSPNGWYTITFNIPGPQDYSLVAVPTAAPQTSDNQCKKFTLFSTGQQTSQDVNHNDTTPTCWGSK